jgi:hypothetical protein
MAKQAKQKYRDAEIEQADKVWNVLRDGKVVCVMPTKESAIKWIDRNSKTAV